MNPRSLRLAAIGAGAIAASLGAAASAQTVYALTVQGNLISFDASNPGAINTVGAIGGAASGVASYYRGIDFRTATSELYLVEEGDVTDSIYSVNTLNAAATLKSVFSTNLAGGDYGVDFNPVPDRLRTTSVTGQNLRTNVDTGAVTVDGALNYVAGDPNFGDGPFVVASAYTNSLFGVLGGLGTTTLFNLDARDDILVIQNPPNSGGLVTVGAVGFDFHTEVGLDIYYNGSTNTAFASLTAFNGSTSDFYSIDLASGAGTFIGTIGGGVAIRDIAVIPAPGAIGLLSLIPLVGSRRRR